MVYIFCFFVMREYKKYVSNKFIRDGILCVVKNVIDCLY